MGSRCGDDSVVSFDSFSIDTIQWVAMAAPVKYPLAGRCMSWEGTVSFMKRETVIRNARTFCFKPSQEVSSGSARNASFLLPLRSASLSCSTDESVHPAVISSRNNPSKCYPAIPCCRFSHQDILATRIPRLFDIVDVALINSASVSPVCPMAFPALVRAVSTECCRLRVDVPFKATARGQRREHPE